ncbi:MAG TPA: iron ABC transporter permease [Ideonella sp.]|uniref:FecCD family ABC transporter permease n=1 Tax=Ideonella sp. TaxID=1929293 RepID=UPI002E32821B|nr:iron ABC transporter permease [Ideonella sp.]HEX5686865.1 iron ABC transporter permease [Ideonella sp.]
MTPLHTLVRLPRDQGWPLGAGTAVLALVLVLLAGTVQLGAVPVNAADWVAPWRVETMSGGAQVLWQLRVPRALLALGVGAGLGLAGTLAQGLFRNPMADPGLLGITSGGACAAALVLTLFAGAHTPVPEVWRPWVLPAAALAGGLTVCFGLDRLARWLTPGSVAGLLLTGLALNALTMAVVGLCSFLATDEQLRSLNFWTLGSLAGGHWGVVVVLGAVLVLALPASLHLSNGLNALALGEAAAGHVGLDVARLRAQVIALVALLCGLSVAWCGVIGFIGLMAPHLARLLVGADQRRLLPLAAGLGGALLLAADTVARTIALPAEIPVGIFTALLGAPLFLAMLRGAARSGTT